MYAASERRQQAHPPVAELVEASLDHQRPVVWDCAGCRLIVEIAQEIFRGGRLEVVLGDQAVDGGRPGHAAEFANQAADGVAELHRPSTLIAVPEGHLARLARRGGDEDAVVGDLFNAPGRGAESERLADLRLEHHFLVELADPHRSVGAGEKDSVEPAIGNGSGVGDGDTLGAFTSRHRAAHSVPCHTGPSSANSSEG